MLAFSIRFWFFFSSVFFFQQDETTNTTSRSELSFVPSTEDDGKSITCRAENPKVTGLFLETTWKLNVVCEYTSIEYLLISFRIFFLFVVAIVWWHSRSIEAFECVFEVSFSPPHLYEELGFIKCCRLLLPYTVIFMKQMAYLSNQKCTVWTFSQSSANQSNQLDCSR